MKRLICTFLFAAALGAAPLAATAAGPVTGADGVLRFPFGNATAPTVYCAPFYVCDITLEPGETILNVAVGDSVRWVLSQAASGTAGDTPHILIKPTDANLDTNLIVTTSKRAYYANLRSAKAPPMLRVGFFYPHDATPAVPPPAPAPSTAPAAADEPAPALLDFNYKLRGDRKLFPARVYNDGTHTYVQFATQLQSTPALLAIGPNGDQLINYRVKDATTYIVDGVPDQLSLIVGSGKGSQRATLARVQ